MRLARLLCSIFAAALATAGSIAHTQATVVENESAVLYVDAQSGSDSNSGTSASPLKTIQAAISKANANNQRSIGTKIVINSGIYREAVNIAPITGQTAAPLTVEAATTGAAIISASDLLSGWSPDPQYSGAFLTNWTPAQSTCALPTGWPSVQEIALHTVMIFVDGVPMTQVLAYSDLKRGTFFVNTADGTLHLFPPSGIDPSSASIEAASRAKTVSVVGRTNIVLRGLVLEHAASCVNTSGATITSSNNVLLDAVQANWNNWGGLAVSGSTNVTVQNSVASYNGGVGFQGTRDQTTLYTNNETDFNNWRGAQAAFYNWAMGGTKLFQMRTTTVQNHLSYNNQAQGLWFDTDNQHITINHVTLSGSHEAALQLERNEGPITLENSYLCSSGVGLNVLTTEGLTASNNVFYNNGATNKYQAQLYLAGTAGGINITNWQTGQVYDLITTGTVLSGNSFIDSAAGQFVFGTYLGGNDWTDFISTLKSDNNTWFDPNTTTAFRIVNGKSVNLAGWQTATGADLNSVWTAPAAAPALACAPPAASYPDFNISLDSGSYAMSSGVAAATVRVDSFNFGAVNLSVSGLPAGVTASFSAPSLISGVSTLTLIASSASTAQTVPVTLWGISGDRVHSATFNLTVSPNSGVTSTSTSLAVSAPSISQNAPITLTATVQPSSGSIAPSGTVTFYADGAVLGTATLTAGVANLTTSALPVGAHSITATYTGAAAFSASTSNAINLTVNPASAVTTTTLSASASSITQGAAITLTAIVKAAASTPAGSVTFYNGSTAFGSASLSSGMATLSISDLPVGATALTATYSGTGAFSSSTSNVISIQVNAAVISTATTLVASATSITQGSAVTLTATVRQSSGTIAPGGSVTFYSGSTLLGSATLSSGTAGISVSTLPTGSNSISAAYSGAVSFNASSSGIVAITVNPAAPVAVDTATSLASSATSITQNTAVTFVATVKQARGTTLPTGSVTFLNGTTVIGSSPLVSGIATFTTSALNVGSASISAGYAGTASFNPSKSNVVSLVVNPAVVATTTHLVASSLSTAQNSPITLTATVKAASGTTIPAGSVTFIDGNTIIGSAVLSGGIASFSTTAMAVGLHSVTATYSGSAAFLKSTSNPLGISVTPQPIATLVGTTTALTSSTAQADQGYAISLSASVAAATGTAYPTGQVVFSMGHQNLGSATLANGRAYLVTAALPVGDDAITAAYSGDTSFAPSASSAIHVTISGPDFTIRATPGTVSATRGSSADLALLITPQNGFDQLPQMSCSGLPAGATCSFGSPAKQPDGTSLVNMTIHTSSATADTNGSPSSLQTPRPIAFALLPLLLCLSSRRRREFRRLLSLSLLVLAIVLGGSAIGCGGKSATTSAANSSSASSTIKITITAQTTTGLSHSTDVQLTLM